MAKNKTDIWLKESDVGVCEIIEGVQERDDWDPG
jgi:hypothetical protein